MNISRITISSEDNPDWNGTWTEDEIRQEMDEVGIDPSNAKRWIDYVFEMALDSECPDEIVKTFVNTPEIKSIKLVLPSGTAKIEKF